jgi:hypothetical protein
MRREGGSMMAKRHCHDVSWAIGTFLFFCHSIMLLTKGPGMRDGDRDRAKAKDTTGITSYQPLPLLLQATACRADR